MDCTYGRNYLVRIACLSHDRSIRELTPVLVSGIRTDRYIAALAKAQAYGNISTCDQHLLTIYRVDVSRNPRQNPRGN